MNLRRLLIALAGLVVAVVVVPRLPPVRTAVLTAALVPEMLDWGPQPLSLLVPRPRPMTTTYGLSADRLDVYLPVHAVPDRSLPAVVLALGVHPQPIDHPDIVRIAVAIGRLGVAVAIPDSTALRELRVTPQEAGHLADAVMTVAGLPQVDPDRVGLAGFSAGASIALVAATDARIVDRLAFVSAFGGYAHAERLLVDVATRTSLQDGTVISWQPDPGIRRDILELALGTLPADARPDLHRRLDPVVASSAPPRGPDSDDLAGLAGDARAIYLLFTAESRPAADDAIAQLSGEVRAHLAGISPLPAAAAVRAPVFLLHGEPDTAIPVAHAQLIEEAVGVEVIRSTRFGRFGHEQPGLGGLGIDDASDIWELSLYLRDIVAAATE